MTTRIWWRCGIDSHFKTTEPFYILISETRTGKIGLQSIKFPVPGKTFPVNGKNQKFMQFPTEVNLEKTYDVTF